jgi:hypothetical protein
MVDNDKTEKIYVDPTQYKDYKNLLKLRFLENSEENQENNFSELNNKPSKSEKDKPVELKSQKNILDPNQFPVGMKKLYDEYAADNANAPADLERMRTNIRSPNPTGIKLIMKSDVMKSISYNYYPGKLITLGLASLMLEDEKKCYITVRGGYILFENDDLKDQYIAKHAGHEDSVINEVFTSKDLINGVRPAIAL